ncbi:MAG: ABC transporter ATP-binding protein [Breznakibacter sp.]
MSKELSTMQTSIKESLQYMIKAVKMIWVSSPRWSLINLLMVVMRGTIPLLMLWVIKELIDQVSQAVTNGGSGDAKVLMGPLLLTGLFFVVNALIASLHSVVREKQSYLVNDHIAAIIHKKTTHIRYGYFEDSEYQDVFYRALNESTFRPARIFYSLAGIIQNLITLAIIGIILLSIHPAMIMIALLISIPILWFRIGFSRKFYRLLRQQTADERRVAYYNRVLTAKDYAKEVRIFDLGDLFKFRYEELRHSLRHKQLALLIKKSLRETAVQVFIALMMVVVFGYVILNTVKGNFTIGTMTMYFVALQRGYSVLQDFLSRITSLYEDNLFLKNFFEFLNISTDDGSDMQRNFPVPIRKGIELRNVSFKYPGTNRSVLSNLSLTIQQGETIAIVGANGSGKTTLVKLLCGLYEPTNGEILIDGIRLGCISRKELAEQMTVIFQDFMLYNVSARENIWFGNIHRAADDASIQDAALKADVHTLFSNLKNGYSTQLGTLFKESEQLSQGEWQRTALARAFFNQAQVIILDEPTSSLDAFTEAAIINNFRNITKDKTAIIISHRLSTINMADRIVVLEDHAIAEVGTPAELLSRKGCFSGMMESLKNQ